MSIYMNSKSIHFLNINKLAKCMQSALPHFCIEKGEETLQKHTPHSLSLSQYIHTYCFLCTCERIVTERRIKHTPEHARVFACIFIWVQVILIQLTASDCTKEEMFDMSGLLFDLEGRTGSFTLTRKFWLEKTDDCLCLSQNERIYSVYHQVMIFIIFFIDFSSKCRLLSPFKTTLYVIYMGGN